MNGLDAGKVLVGAREAACASLVALDAEAAPAGTEERVGVRAAHAVARADVHGHAAVAGGQKLRDEAFENLLLAEVREAALLDALLGALQVQSEPVEILLRSLRHAVKFSACAVRVSAVDSQRARGRRKNLMPNASRASQTGKAVNREP